MEPNTELLLASMEAIFPELAAQIASRKAGNLNNRIALPGDRVLFLSSDGQWKPGTVDQVDIITGPMIVIRIVGHMGGVDMLDPELWHRLPVVKMPAPYDVVRCNVASSGEPPRWVYRAVENSGTTAFQVEACDRTYTASECGIAWQHVPIATYLHHWQQTQTPTTNYCKGILGQKPQEDKPC